MTITVTDMQRILLFESNKNKWWKHEKQYSVQPTALWELLSLKENF